jgi:histidine triad (HIT) family protein
MQESIFTKIINGDIPAYKIYEDEKTLAFLDIHPARPGHTLIVPKSQVDRLENLADEDYAAVLATVRKVMQRIVAIFGQEYRACLKLEGFDVPHAHVHVIPCRNGADFWTRQDMEAPVDHEGLAAMANKLAFK